MTRILWTVTVITLICCNQVSTEDCERACHKPYELVAAAEQPRIDAWKQMPQHMAEPSAKLAASWKQKLVAEKNKYQTECVSSCLSEASPKDIKCRVRARNNGEWKRCR